METTITAPPPSPPEGLDVSPIGSPHNLADDVHEALSEDELVDHTLDHDHRLLLQPTGALTEDLKRRIIKQVEYYFSDGNLANDKHMINLIRKNKEGFVPIAIIASFRKMKKLIRDYALIATALRESTSLVVNSDGKKVKRLHPFLLAETKDSKLYTVLVENLPEDHSVENIQQIFGEAGKIKNICLRDPHAIEASSKGDRAEKFISSKLYALVEYETVEAAEKAVATLNNEQNWRSGMRVKLLKQAAKHGQRKQMWRPADSEKNHSIQLPDRTKDEGNHNTTEQHDDTPDEEDAAHSYKQKNEHRVRNRGRSGRQKHRGANGMGHGNSWSASHPHEPPKPPPGPRMPDGTRGFTIGRGRPPISDQS
ncbi:hypothetical protein CsatB_001945 [Cannabis sativa]|uniref:La-related protein 6A n=1 Tax=Cannabis sativa TaxID=3483 RepID=A0A7J6ER76_CANSA|nr:la-related protein 6A [Cannabis sativa]KAF4360170.1 hypothetical protein F8388_000039 [Cannabis sativa]